ncbi:MAG: SufE family protein [Candidatus Shikimatogenerans sp. JK-2022]|nr:SufE family protein [Candidatus Shikimatogenerans bostrichidophilus]
MYKKIIKNIKNNNIYNYLINLGKKLPKYPKKYKKKKYLLKNCQTNLWLYFYFKKKKLFIIGKSNSNIINGILYLIIKIYSKKKPLYIIKKNNKFLNKINLHKILSFNRYINIFNIIKEIKLKALIFFNKKNK